MSIKHLEFQLALPHRKCVDVYTRHGSEASVKLMSFIEGRLHLYKIPAIQGIARDINKYIRLTRISKRFASYQNYRLDMGYTAMPRFRWSSGNSDAAVDILPPDPEPDEVNFYLYSTSYAYNWQERQICICAINGHPTSVCMIRPNGELQLRPLPYRPYTFYRGSRRSQIQVIYS